MFTGASIEPAEALADATEAIWARLGEPGPTLSGAERVAVMHDARRALAGEPVESDARARAAAGMAARPQDATARWIDELEADGLARDSYVEVVGVVSRTVAVDTFVRGVGAAEPELPAVVDRPPTGERDPDAKQRSAFVPMVGPAWPPGTLSWLPSETAALVEVHDTLYLTMEEMVDMEIVRDLTRVQVELVASRTSWHNDCFY